jgi:murein L,D-transpeptidase YcbB/YkuD
MLRLGYSSIIITDSYDNDTVQLIKAVQAKYGLHVDGIVGPFTKMQQPERRTAVELNTSRPEKA